MRLKAVTLQNFRRYRDRTVIPIDQLTAFIGRGDVGKSTILEALDIFFEGDVVKIEASDASTSGDNKDVRIGAIFTDLPSALDLDRGARTTLEAEHLVNGDGDLEIFKVYNCSVQKVTSGVFARAMHPRAEAVAGLLQKSNPDLKRLVKERGVEDNCQQNNNPSMRQALYDAAGELQLGEMDVPLNEADAKNAWEAIKKNLPIYALFRSDRASSDQDPEAQNPMKLAIQSALRGLASELEEITRKVEEAAGETAQRTLDQLRESYPDLELASVLKPSFRRPNWAAVFKLDLESDDQIPLNKRGSGVRRLVLLSFFQAEAARLRRERRQGGQDHVRVIYAVEEPETSQHPDSQERIIRAFRGVAESGDQVLVTTHVPGLAGLLPLESLRFVDTDPDREQQARVRIASDHVFAEIAEALGVLPDPSEKTGARVAVAVEGPTDIDALESLAEVLKTSGDLQRFDPARVFWTIGGGQTLKDWVERRYLDRLGIPQIYLFDSDRTSAALPAPEEKKRRVSEINCRPNCRAYLSQKRTIENYVHPDAIARLSANKIALPADIDLDFADITAAFRAALKAAKEAHNDRLGFYPVGHDGRGLGIASNETNCKKIITAYVMRNMTSEEIKERGRYTGADGREANEIIEWLSAIEDHL